MHNQKAETKSLQRVPAFQLMLSEKQFRAIGHMTVQWAFLESEIDRELDWLNEQNDKPVKLRAPFEHRAERWREMAALTYEEHPKLIEAVESISNAAAKIKGERDKFVHGNLSSSGVFFRIRDARIVEVSDTGTPAHIEDLACRISDINAALFRHQAELNRVFETPV